MISEEHGEPNTQRLVVFDVEGVLLPKRRYLAFEAARQLNFWRFLESLFIGILYEVGLKSLESTLRRIFENLKGLTLKELFHLFQRLPLVYGAEELFRNLKQTGWTIALISSGLPQPFVETLAARLNADYAYGLDLEIVNDRLTGRIGGTVIKQGGKAIILRKLQKTQGFAQQNCAVVADDRNNLPMFPLCALRIGYNPDFLLSFKSNLVITGELPKILAGLNQKAATTRNLSISREMAIRESIHISGVLVPLVSLYLLPYFSTAFLILILTLLYVSSELARIEGINIPIISSVTRRAATKPELNQFVTAPIFFALGIVLSLLLFPVPISYAAIAILALGDGAAALFGGRFGRTPLPFNKGKKVEGTIFGTVFALFGALLFIPNPFKASIGAVAGMVFEALPAPIDDNLTIPLVAGLALLIL